MNVIDIHPQVPEKRGFAPRHFVGYRPSIESVFTRVAYHASRYALVPVKPEYFPTIGFSLLKQSLTKFRKDNRGHKIAVVGVVIDNGFYDGGNDEGPENRSALKDIIDESSSSFLRISEMMRGNCAHLGRAMEFGLFGQQFFNKIGFNNQET